MSTESGEVESDSEPVLGASASRFENERAHKSETLADSEAQELVVKKLTGTERKRCVSSAASDDDVTEKRNGFCDPKKKRKTESVDVAETNGGGIENDSEDIGENLKLLDSDLVWAKVRSYPWWPGQVFDSSIASKKAMKYFKKGNCSLVTYFGDCTFAWNDSSCIKPFHQFFSQMVNQSKTTEFRHAIDCALEEVSRRVEFGLSCSCCISEEAYEKLKTQKITNPGIREESRVRYHGGGDKLSNAVSFKPAKVWEFMKHLACFPSYDATDELRFVIYRAQLLAFQQWKSYLNFPKYETFIKPVDFAAPEASLPQPNTDEEEMSSKKIKTANKDNDDQKGRIGFEDNTDEKPKKKKKTLSDFIAKNRSEKSCSAKKRKVESLESGKTEKNIKKKKMEKPKHEELAPEEIPSSSDEMIITGKRIITESAIINQSEKKIKKNKKMEKPKHNKQLAPNEISSSSPDDEMISSLHADKTGKGIIITESSSISIDPWNYEKFVKELSCSSSNLNIDSKTTSESWNVKDSSEEHEIFLPDAKARPELIPDSISIDPSNYEDFEEFLKELSCSNNNLNGDSKKMSIIETSESMDVQTGLKDITSSNSKDQTSFLKDSSEELTGLKDITASGSKEQTGLKDSSEEQTDLKDITGSGSKEQTGLKDITSSGSKEQTGLKDSSEEQSGLKDITGSGAKEKTGLKDITGSGAKEKTGLKDIGSGFKEQNGLKDASEEKTGLKDATGSGSKEQTGLKEQNSLKDIGSGVKEQTGFLKESSSTDSLAPNTLILNFADSGSVPSVEKLNEIFNCYGSLIESETKVMKKNGKRAKVVFERSEDAKTAFSSAGKYSVFGPSLLSYKLKYVCIKTKQSKNMTKTEKTLILGV